MARYNTFKYGDGTKYGLDATTNTLWALEIAWNGSFTGANEANRLIGVYIKRGRDFIINSSDNGFAHMNSGRALFKLDNWDRKYDPYNTLSPLYPNVLPGKQFRLRAKDGTSGTLRYLISGYIDDIQPVSGRNEVMITGVDSLEYLRKQDISIGAVKESIRVDDALEDILTAAGITNYDIDNSSDILRYWWIDKKRAADAIGEIEDANVGTFFIAADGIAKYYSKNHSISEVLSIGSDDIKREIKLTQPWELIRNQIEIIVNPRVKQSNAVLWSLNGAPLVGDTPIEIWAQYTYNNIACPALNVTAPAGDFKVNSQADGLGVDLTANFSYVLTAFPETAKLVITKNSGNAGYVIEMKVFGEAITLPNSIVIRDSDTNSIAAYGTRMLHIDSTWIQDSNVAISLASWLIGLFASSRKNPIIQMEQRPDIQFIPDLLDRVTLQVPYLSIDGAYQIGSIETEWMNENGQAVLTIFGLEPVIGSSESYWIFPTLIGVTSIFG